MENEENQKDLEKGNNMNEQSEGKPNTENGDLDYTENEVEYADGHGTLLDEEIDDQDEQASKE
jgi:hypothetical protein